MKSVDNLRLNRSMNKKSEEILEISHVTNRYRDSGSGFFSRSKMTRVLNDVDLTIHRDEIFGLVGESGCGKSTLGKAVLGLIPFDGQIKVAGMEYSRKNRQEFTRCVQAVFQDPLSSLNPRRTIAATLEEPLLAHGIGTPESRRAKAIEMLELVGLDGSYADRLPRELSGGQRQRVCIGAALMIDPELVIADEATSALDVSVGAQILNLFQEIHDRKDFAMLFISHNLNVVYYLCDRIAVMYRGSIVEQGDSAPDGCDFYHRCPFATDQCRQRPELTDVLTDKQGTEKSSEHFVRCWNPVR